MEDLLAGVFELQKHHQKEQQGLQQQMQIKLIT